MCFEGGSEGFIASSVVEASLDGMIVDLSAPSRAAMMIGPAAAKPNVANVADSNNRFNGTVQ